MIVIAMLLEMVLVVSLTSAIMGRAAEIWPGLRPNWSPRPRPDPGLMDRPSRPPALDSPADSSPVFLIVVAAGLTLAGLLAAPFVVRPCKGGPCDLASAIQSARADTRILDRRGVLLGRVRPYTYVHQAELPAYVPALFLSVEDARFRFTPCVDPIGFARAAVHTLGGHREGASGICMQAVRFLPLTHPLREDGSLVGKIAETTLALHLYLLLKGDHDQILDLYLNTVGFGRSASGIEIRGIEAAAWAYFAKPAVDLSMGEAATLVGMLKATTRYSPRLHPDLAAQRRATVLRLLVEQFPEYREEAGRARQAPVIVRRPAVPPRANAAYSIAAYDVQQKDSVFRTTLDAKVQKVTERIAISLLNNGSRRAGWNDPRNPVLVAALVMDGRNGEILGYACGRPGSSRAGGWDPCRSGAIALASDAKIFLVASAIEAGVARPEETLETVLARGRTRVVQSTYVRGFCTREARALTVRRALELSNNCLAVALLAALPADELAHLRALHLPFDPRIPSTALGTVTVSPALLAAYVAAIGNGGQIPTPHIADGVALVTPPAPALGYRVETLATVQDLLRGVVDRGTAWRAGRILGPDAYAKTGTNQNLDVRIIGGQEDNSAVALIWLGHAKPRQLAPDLDAGRMLAVPWARLLQATEGISQ